MKLDDRLFVPLVGLLLITLVGAAGFVALEGWSWIDALYMSVITVSTVGFGEVRELSREGRLFTIFLIAGGVGSALYLVSILAEGVVEGQFRRIFQRSAMQRAIEKLQGHIIVCGFGRFGQVVTDEIRDAGRAVVVIDQDPAMESVLDRAGIPFLIGSASVDEVLVRAHIKTAEALVVATSSEADGVFITLAARELNPGIRVYARGQSDPGVRRLRRAGADRVVSPFQMGGSRLAASILRPSVVDFLELSSDRDELSIDLEEIRVADGSALVGRRVADVEAEMKQLRIVAVKLDGHPLELVPSEGATIEAGHHLVLVGARAALARLSKQAGAG